ncbi:hypothetical protein ZWY2020_045485 [Hordeum vulgare]|nr:hypothetical protein ZWY2020_045485 [Hordeum vulgare]
MAPPTRVRQAAEVREGPQAEGYLARGGGCGGDAAARLRDNAGVARVGEWSDGRGKVVAHYGFIPLVIAVGVIRIRPQALPVPAPLPGLIDPAPRPHDRA